MFQSVSHKMTLMLSAACLLMAGTSHAAEIAFTNAGPGGLSVSPGSVAGFLAFIDQQEIPGNVLSYTIAGLTIDDDGLNNDTVTVNIALSATDSTAVTEDNPTGANAQIFADDQGGLHFRAGANGNGGRINPLTDSFTFGEITVSGTSSGGFSYLGSGVYTGVGFSLLNDDDQASVTGDVTGVTTGTVGQAVFELAGTDTSITLRALESGGNTDSIEANNVSFNVTVTAVTSTEVPEPASLAMVGLGALCLLKRRR